MGYMVQEAIEAADVLSQEGIEVEIIDPMTLVPMDLEGILRSVYKTRRLVIVEEGPMRSGFGAELAASVGELAFRILRSPIKRIGALDAPIPYNLRLERSVIPNKERIIGEVQKLFR